MFFVSGDNDFAAALRAVEEVSRGATVAALMTPPFAHLRGHSWPPKIETAFKAIWMPEEYRIF